MYTPIPAGWIWHLIGMTALVFLVNLFVALSTAPGAWARAAAYLISIPAAACFFFRIGINPRLRLQDRCWESGLTLEEKLDRIYDIQKIPRKQIVKEHFEKQRLAVIGVALICMIVLVFSVYRDAVKADDYQKRMSTIAVSAGNTGARYAVYDENAGKFVKDCLKKEQLAQTPEDVRAVLYIRSGSQLLTTYGEAGYMYMRYALIRMVDQKTGETVGERYVYGYMSSRLYEQTQNGTRAAYGEYPEKEDIEEAIEELIEAFEYTIK